LLVDAHGAPLSIVVTAANCNDCTKLAELLEAKVVRAEDEQVENLRLDAGYVGTQEVARQAGYVPHIRPRGEEKSVKKKNPSFKPRRWVVELSHSWFNRFRKLSPRYEKTTRSYLGLVMLAATMIVLNKVKIIYG
jgi:putative transposase